MFLPLAELCAVLALFVLFQLLTASEVYSQNSDVGGSF